MMILVTAMFLLALALLALYLYVSGVFTNRRAFRFFFYILLACFGLTIGIGIQHFNRGYDLAATPRRRWLRFWQNLRQLCNKRAERLLDQANEL